MTKIKQMMTYASRSVAKENNFFFFSLPLVAQTRACTQYGSSSGIWESSTSDPVPPLLATCPKDYTFYYRNPCSSVLINPLVIITRNCKQSRYSSADEQIMKSQYNYTKEYYSAIQKVNLLVNGQSWKKIILSEVAQTPKINVVFFSSVQTSAFYL